MFKSLLGMPNSNRAEKLAKKAQAIKLARFPTDHPELYEEIRHNILAACDKGERKTSVSHVNTDLLPDVIHYMQTLGYHAYMRDVLIIGW